MVQAHTRSRLQRQLLALLPILLALIGWAYRVVFTFF